MIKPQYVIEVEQHTGLECVLIPETTNSWQVISPTGVELFKIGGNGPSEIGMISMPDMYNSQGVSKQIRHAQRKASR